MPIPTSFVLPDPEAPSPLRALHSLREKHVRILARTLSQLPGSWSLERHEGCDGDLMLMLMPQQAGLEQAGLEQADRANLVISREADGFHLIANHDDDYRELGCFGGMDELVATVRADVQAAARNRAASGCG